MRQHHFEVVVPVEDDGRDVGLPYVNDGISAYWHSGTIYDTGLEDDDGVGDGWTDENVAAGEDDAASLRLWQVLGLPVRLLDIYREGWDEGDGWDIGILESVAAELCALGLTDPSIS